MWDCSNSSLALSHQSVIHYHRRMVLHFYHASMAWSHYEDFIMSAMASQITSLTIVYLTVYSGTDDRKHQSSASLAFVQGIRWWPVNSPHNRPVTRKMFPFDDIIMIFHQYSKCTSSILRILTHPTGASLSYVYFMQPWNLLITTWQHADHNYRIHIYFIQQRLTCRYSLPC